MLFNPFEKLTTPFPTDAPQSPPTGIIAFCRHYTKGFEKPLVVMTILSAIIAVSEVLLFGFLGQLVDWLADHDRTSFLAEEGWKLFAMGALIVVGIPLLILLRSLILFQALLGNYPMAIRWQMHRFLLRQSVTFYQDEFSGRIATKVMQTALSVREAIIKLTDITAYILIYFISIIIMIGNADIRLVIPLIVWLVIYVSIQLYFIPKLKAVASEQADARATMMGRIVDSYANISTTKLFSHTDRETEYAAEGMKGFLVTVYRQMRLVTVFLSSAEFINYLLVFAISSLSIWLWLEDSISIGAITIAIALALRINSMSFYIMGEISGLFENIGTIIDGIQTFSKPITVEDKPDAPPLTVNKGEINFKDVSFHYGEGKGVIEHIDLIIKPGEKVGLVGHSGAGKSTLVNLLLRFYDVEKGAVLIDGQNISDVTQDSLRAHIGMVTQDTSLLHRSIRENISYGRPDATDQEIIKAAKQAHAHDFIETLTDNFGNQAYDAEVGERGVKLSGGQRQRIAIARVLLKNAPILVLDEATSALDSEVEAAIQESLNQLMDHKTVIAIAHRLSTIARMDRLIILNQGYIAEQGTHQELIKHGGIYAHLWAHQTGGFIGCDEDKD